MNKGDWKKTTFWSRCWHCCCCCCCFFLLVGECLTWINIPANIWEGGSRCWWCYSTSHVTSHLLTKVVHNVGGKYSTYLLACNNHPQNYTNALFLSPRPRHYDVWFSSLWRPSKCIPFSPNLLHPKVKQICKCWHATSSKHNEHDGYYGHMS